MADKIVRVAWTASVQDGQYSSAVFMSPDGQWGVRNVNTQEVIVPAGTALQKQGNLFVHDFPAPAGEQYEYYILFSGNLDNPTGTSTQYPAQARVHDVVFSAFDWSDYRTLGGVRRLVVELSGRYDLLRDPENDDWTDDRGLLTFYVNEAQKWLDMRFTMPKHPASLYKRVPAGAGMVTMQHARFVLNVEELKDTGETVGIPWMTHYNGLAPEQELETSQTLPEASGSIYFGKHWDTYSPITSIWIQPENRDRVIIVRASFFTRELKNALDRSYWTVQHPRLLAQTVMYLFEIPMRNSQGVKDLFEPIMDELIKAYHDYCAELAAGPAEHWMMRS